MDVQLRLGPMLRRVSETSAAIWVETRKPGTVKVAAGEGPREVTAAANTFTVHGHHYALVDVEGLAPGSALPYRVLLDGAQVWPLPDSPHPPSLLRTLANGEPTRILFGSCHTPTAHTAEENSAYGVDMLRAYATRLARRRADSAKSLGREEPSALLLIGDQVYADEIQPRMAEFLRQRRAETAAEHRREAQPPDGEVVFFDEYAELYRQAWSDPDIRWLLSTVPTLMLFDDHDIRDDWNTSGAWRREIAANPWWRPRIISGLGAYWIYQHLGNLTPAERASDPVFSEVAKTEVSKTEADSGEAVDEFAWRAHSEPTSYRWSYRFDIGRSRILAVDARCGRVVEDDTRRSMLGSNDSAWLDGQLTGDVDHLVIASTLPFLLPAGVHYLEAWNEAVCAGKWGAAARQHGERLRQGADLEHWAAFQMSFESVSAAVLDVASGRRGAAPASVLFLGGDVHFSYVARARHRSRKLGGSEIAQLVCSPIRNRLPTKFRYGTRLAATGIAGVGARLVARAAGIRAPALRWRIADGPRYNNTLATLVLNGRTAEAAWEHASATEARIAEGGIPRIEVWELMRHRLAG